MNIQRFIVLGWAAITLCLGTPLLAKENKAQKKPIPCKAPDAGPVWFQDFSPVQRQALSAEWETEGRQAFFKISGTYPETAKEKRNYKKFESETEIEATEEWKCDEDGDSEFVKISGKFETETEWEVILPQGVEEGELEDEFEIVSINEVRHLEHEQEVLTIAEAEGTRKEVKEKEEWEQSWSKGKFPYVKGTIENSMVFDSTIPAKGTPGHEKQSRMLASLGMDALVSATEKTIIREKVEEKSTLDGPGDIVSSETIRTVVSWKGEEDDDNILNQIETKKSESRKYKLTKKGYQFVSSTEVTEEVSQDKRREEKVTNRKVEYLTDLEKAPTKVAYWEYKERPHGAGRLNSFTLSSNRFGALPKLFNKSRKDGTYKRFTEFDKAGRIRRFYVMYFPANKRGNEMILDYNFSPHGYLNSFMVKDGNSEWAKTKTAPYDASFMTPLRQVLKQVAKLDSLNVSPSLESYEPKESNFPKLVRQITY